MGGSEEMFIHFAYYRGDASKKGLMFAAAISGEEPEVIDIYKDFIPERIMSRLHDNEVKKYYILPYDIFSEMLRIFNIRRHQGSNVWISLGRRLSWLGICEENDAKEEKLADIFPAAGRLINKFKRDYLSICLPDRFFGRIHIPGEDSVEWKNARKYMSATVKLEQEFVNWCRIQNLTFPYEKYYAYSPNKKNTDEILDELWSSEGRFHSKQYWIGRYKEWKADLKQNPEDTDRCDLALNLKKEYVGSYAANEKTVRYCALESLSVWHGDICNGPEYIMRYIPSCKGRFYCLISFNNLDRMILMKHAGISDYAAERSCRYGISAEETDKFLTYTERFADALKNNIYNHGGETIDDYFFLWSGAGLIIRHESGRACIIERPALIEGSSFFIKDRYGTVISIPRLIILLAYQEAELVCMKKISNILRRGAALVDIKGCKALVSLPDCIDEMCLDNMKQELKIDKYCVIPEITIERSAYGYNERGMD